MSLPLHVEGRHIKNSLDNTVILYGVNKHGFEDHPYGHWQTLAGGILYDTWDEGVIKANLDAMKSWGVNCVRMYSTAEFWIDNTLSHRAKVKELAGWMSDRGMYLVYSFWHVSEGSGSPDMPYPPYSLPGDELVIADEAAFVAMWASVATELAAYDNVIFEFWNEPRGAGQASWFSTVQLCINAIRAAGATNLLLVPWGYSIGMNLDYPNGAKLDWVSDYPLTDSSNNLVYTFHIYRGDIHYTEPVRLNCWEYTDLKLGHQLCLVEYVLDTLDKPVLVGEIGPNMWQTGEELQRECDFYRNCLIIFKEWGMGYLGFWWWLIGTHQHLTSEANYQPNAAGRILSASIQNQKEKKSWKRKSKFF